VLIGQLSGEKDVPSGFGAGERGVPLRRSTRDGKGVPLEQRTHDEEGVPVGQGADGAAGAVETPSGKGARDENFPVGSFLIAKDKRPHVMAYYAFARAADDIADNPALPAAEKIARLDALEASLRADGPLPTPRRLALSFAATGVSDSRGRDLLRAFRQDAVKTRYAAFSELIDYCTYSANPVGRFLLDLHGEDPAAYPASDALCTVLQILNHLQDLKADYQALDRVYLPLDWLAEEGLDVDSLAAEAASPPLRRVLDRALDASAGMIAAARRLPQALADRRMAAEAATIAQLAERLHRRLRAGDPLATRVALTKADFAGAAARGLFTLVTHRRQQPRRRGAAA
jgi:squalene synthase HpnC